VRASIRLGFDADLHTNELITTQFIAKRFDKEDERHIRVINHSWGDSPLPNEPNDGNFLLTLGMDWIASEFDVLNIFAGNEYDDANLWPSDNYNGITVAMSEQFGGVYQVVHPSNDNEDLHDADGDRVSVDIMAPGANITVASPGVGNPTSVPIAGTSQATAHVTGTVALLNEYGDERVDNSGSFRWNVDNTRKHEVMKAVLLNSADKLDGVHGSTRTAIDENGLTWEQSVAFSDDTIALDRQMGAGHLNAKRALRQFSSGEYNNGEVIPSIGWDYDETAGFPTDRVYSIGQFGGGYVAVTLAWDRGVTKSGGSDDTYSPPDFFTGQTFVDDLDVFIVPVGWEDPIGEAVAMSITTEDTVEHIFKEIPAGEYELVVRQFSGGDRDYGLAWWLGTNAGVPIEGDFDDDGDVDGDDLGEWRNDFGQTAGSDADGDGDSDGADFLVWQQNLGIGVPSKPAAAAVPEPAAWMLVAVVLPILVRRRA
jgi:hypothetical protein